MIMSVTLPQRSVHFFTTLSISFISPAVCIMMMNPSADTLLLQPAGRCSSEGSVISSFHRASTRNYSISCTHTTTINQPSEISFHAALAPSPSATIEACGDGSSPPTDQALSLSGLYLLQAPASAQTCRVVDVSFSDQSLLRPHRVVSSQPGIASP
ncbi:hypothetical protein PVAP13_9KG519126, partial [Panicum virgatum]